MNIHAIHHVPKSNYAFALDENHLVVRVRTAKNNIDKIKVIYADKFDENNKKEVRMEKILSDELFDYYEAILFLKDTRFTYFFQLYKGDQIKNYIETGVQDKWKVDNTYYNYFQYPAIVPADIHKKPSWIDNAIFYQIFIERFFNGNTDNDPEKLSKWGAKPNYHSFYGGDLEGIIQKIDYLAELGINALYLTPIFEANTNHKYNTTDYMAIDHNFGNKEIFKALVEKAHAKGIKVILDAVFNHCGLEFAPFQDVMEKGRNSKYFEWFFIEDYPLKQDPPNYKTFAYSHKMPKLNTSSPEVKAYLLNIATYWIREFDIDGWRLDVSDEIDHHFWRAFRDEVKEIKPDAIIIGENWYDAFPWLQGDQFDSVMNYPVTKACIEYFVTNHLDAKGFTNRLSTLLIRNTRQVNEMLLNLLDSHDVPRFLTLCKGNKEKLKMAAIFMMTYVGIPCTYYGTEIGMKGGADPDCRRTFEWNETKWDKDLWLFYKKIIAIRKQEEALRTGKVKFRSTEKIVIIERYTEKEKIIIVINNTEGEQKLSYRLEGKECIDLITEQRLDLIKDILEDNLLAFSAKIYKAKQKEN